MMYLQYDPVIPRQVFKKGTSKSGEEFSEYVEFELNNYIFCLGFYYFELFDHHNYKRFLLTYH